MSWDIYLWDDRGHQEGYWNYTHNTNTMVNEALRALDYEIKESNSSVAFIIKDDWLNLLDGMEGIEGAKLLQQIFKELRSNPQKYRQFDPPNGWGDYEGITRILEEMSTKIPEWPCKWEAH